MDIVDLAQRCSIGDILSNTSYSSTGCTPTTIFHGRESLKPIDVRINNEAIKELDPRCDFLIELQFAQHQKFAENKPYLIKAITNIGHIMMLNQMHNH